MSKLSRLASNVLPSSLKTLMKSAARFSMASVPGSLSIELLGLKHATDKLTHGYLPHYETHFRSLRQHSVTLLEIGIGGYDNPGAGGASLRLWRDYFPRGNIFGLDVFDKSPHDSNRIRTLKGDQSNPTTLREVVAAIGPLDIIIDDGSHLNDHILTSFQTLFPLLSPRGIYVIEDINTSYLPAFGGSANPEAADHTAVSMVKKCIDGLNYQYIPAHCPSHFDLWIKAIHCYPKIVFIEKGQNQHFLSPAEAQMLDAAAKSM